ncbi:MAG: hypothetical protein KDC98_23145, partial [Planctomycetes bacterium]|nr:hypothetical protein [Planctomycetota bacterium]
TTDTKTPMMRLNLKATAVATFLLEPAETALGIVAAGEEHGFTVKVIPRAADFAITGAKPFPTGVTATYRRIDDAKPPHWLVTGTFASSWPGNANADLEFETNSKQAPIVTIKVHATVRLPVEAKPPFFSLGRVPLDKGGSARIALSRSDGKQLEVLGLRVEGAKDAAQFVTAHAFKAGSDLIVELVVAAGAPKGLLRGDVVIELDHPTVKERRINFNGFIR